MPSALNELLASKRLLLVGGGKMGMALLQGWLANGLSSEQFIVQEPNPSDALCASGVDLNPDADSLAAARPDVIILAVKPQVIETVLPDLAATPAPASLIISLMAGVSLATLQGMLGDAPAYIRTMPNTPASIGQGMTALFADKRTSDPQRAMADALLGAVGQTVWLDSEKMIDAVTAISGSGPAYLFYMAEALAAAAVNLGISEAMAHQLAMQTIIGSAAMLQQSQADATQLRHDVTSPGGTTEAALDVLMAQNGLNDLMRSATQAAVTRAQALAQIGVDEKDFD